MFSYCGNNPVLYYDQLGYRKDICLQGLDELGSGFIYNQNAEPIGSREMGIATVSHGGCGPVAVHNALQSLGQYDISFEEILQYYEANDYLTCGGLLGTSISGCVRFLEEQGYVVMLVPNTAKNDDIANVADACILWYCYRQSGALPVAAHYVAFTQTNGIGSYYNAYTDQASVYPYMKGSNQFMRNYAEGGLFGVLICIFKP